MPILEPKHVFVANFHKVTLAVWALELKLSKTVSSMFLCQNLKGTFWEMYCIPNRRRPQLLLYTLSSL